MTGFVDEGHIFAVYIYIHLFKRDQNYIKHDLQYIFSNTFILQGCIKLMNTVYI